MAVYFLMGWCCPVSQLISSKHLRKRDLFMTTLIIGAGMAGLAAAEALQHGGQPAIVLEARDRVGGRVQTAHDLADFPVELGAEWIHGADVITWDWVQYYQLEAVYWEKSADALVRLYDGRLLTMPEARRVSPAWDQARGWAFDLPPATGQENFESYLRRVVGDDAEFLSYVRRSFANSAGDSMSRLSARAMLDELADYDRPVESNPDIDYRADFRIVEGYSALYEGMAEHLDIRLNTPIRTIVWGDQGVTAIAANGERFHGEHAVITLPVGVLRSGNVRFEPALPAVKQQALQGLEMGPVMKMVYVFDQPITAPGVSAIFSRHNPPMWWTANYGREDTRVTVWSAFFSGDFAREMLALGEAAALEKGLDALREELGNSQIEPRFARWVNWVDDPYALGGYSITLPGYYEARQWLAQPTPPLYWAGEASVGHDACATVSGALESGLRAAQEILAVC
jgi:monoamine oxidase